MFCYACRSAQLNMNGCMHRQKCIKSLISKVCMRLPTIYFPHPVTKGQKTYATQKLNLPQSCATMTVEKSSKNPSVEESITFNRINPVWV